MQRRKIEGHRYGKRQHVRRILADHRYETVGGYIRAEVTHVEACHLKEVRTHTCPQVMDLTGYTSHEDLPPVWRLIWERWIEMRECEVRNSGREMLLCHGDA